MGRSRELAELAASYDSGNLFGMKNRIINGAMVIDQRNAGAAVSTAGYTIDRWSATNNTTGGAFTVQQSTTVPSVAFTNSIKWTTTTAASALGASESAYISQWVEGYNCADFGLGNAAAVPVTLSFWVRSSLTGTFSISYKNSAANRGYAATYTINAADTWEFKTITVTMDTTGTWVGGNGAGLQVVFSLGAGSSRSVAAGSWQAANVNGATGTTSVVNTLNATFYITGVQLEKGSTATSFDYRPYGTELQLCQRYYQQISKGNSTSSLLGTGTFFSATRADGITFLPVSMRTTPSFSVVTGTNYYRVYLAGTTYNCTTVTFNSSTSDFSKVLYYNNTDFSGMTNGSGWWEGANASASIALTAEL